MENLSKEANMHLTDVLGMEGIVEEEEEGDIVGVETIDANEDHQKLKKRKKWTAILSMIINLKQMKSLEDKVVTTAAEVVEGAGEEEEVEVVVCTTDADKDNAAKVLETSIRLMMKNVVMTKAEIPQKVKGRDHSVEEVGAVAGVLEDLEEDQDVPLHKVQETKVLQMVETIVTATKVTRIKEGTVMENHENGTGLDMDASEEVEEVEKEGRTARMKV